MARCSKCNEVYWGSNGEHVCEGSKPKSNVALKPCATCAAMTNEKRVYEGCVYCERCLHDAYVKDFDLTPNDRTSRFLIKMGSKSSWWKRATQEMRDAALHYYERHGKPTDEAPKAIKKVSIDLLGNIIKE